MTLLHVPEFYGEAMLDAMTLSLTHTDRRAEGPHGHFQREVGPISKWLAKITVPRSWTKDLRVIEAWIAEASRGDNHILVEHPRKPGGSFGVTELITNGHLHDGIEGFTASASTITSNARRIKVKNSGAATGHAYQSVNLTDGETYCLRVGAYAGNVSNFEIHIYDTIGTSDIATVSKTAAGAILLPATVSNTGSHLVELYCDTTTADDFVFYDHISMCRCALVAGGSQTGSSLEIDQIPSGNGLALAGDHVEIVTDVDTGRSELKRLTADLDDDGLLQFTPPLRNSPADNAPVIFHRPRFIGAFSEPEAGSLYSKPDFGGLAFSIEEDVDFV